MRTYACGLAAGRRFQRPLMDPLPEPPMNRFLSRLANARNVSRKPSCMAASFALVAGLGAWAGAAPAAAPLDPVWDTCADTWVATDGVGRSLPLHDATGPPKANRSVGIFYFLWNEGQNPVYDLTKIVAANPDNPPYGPVHSFHHWGEPLFGYYKQDDRYVLRKHMQMLADAGVDVLLLDVTNALTYDSVRDKLLEVLDEMQVGGQRAPAIAFLANSNSAATVERLYQTFYKPGKGRAHWFPWLDKPLLLSPPDGLSDEVRAFFSIRHSWAWTKGQAWFGDGRDKWPWLDNAPQTPGWHEAPDKPEQITVCVAQHPTYTLDFKWADNIQQTGEWSDFTLNGDAAPNDRCNFRAIFNIPPRDATQVDPKP